MAFAKYIVQRLLLLFFVVSVQIQAHSVVVVVVVSAYRRVECHIKVLVVEHLFPKRISKV